MGMDMDMDMDMELIKLWKACKSQKIKNLSIWRGFLCKRIYSFNICSTPA
jgi:hypothetical protein